MKRYLFTVILTFWSIVHCFAYDTLVIGSKNRIYPISKEYFSTFSSTDTAHWSIENISQFEHRFVDSQKDVVSLDNPEAHHWVKFSVYNESSKSTDWILEGYIYRIQDFSVYELQNGHFVEQRSSYLRPSRHKYINHKNFIFPIHIKSDQTKTFYLKLHHPRESTIQIPVIKSLSYFASYSLKEYFFLGLFYGCMIIMAVYNLLLYFFLREKSHLYYVFYLFFGALFFISHDGIGNQYIWSNFPWLCYYIIHINVVFQILFLYLYAREFLRMHETSKAISLIFKGYTLLRFTMLILGITLFPSLLVLHFADIPSFILTYLASFIAYRKGLRYSKFFIIGFTFLLFGFVMYNLRIQNLIPSNAFSFYSMYVATLLEMLMLSLALGDKFNQIKKNEVIQTELNKVLEQKVNERTDEIQHQKAVIEDKKKDLDTLIYRASHDLKGPLKTIMGLSNLGQNDPGNEKEYFARIESSVKKLDQTISSLININKINNTELSFEKISIADAIHTSVEAFKQQKDFEHFKVITEISFLSDFYSSPQIVHSVFQNLIENAFKYRNPNTDSPMLKLKGEVNEDFLEIQFIDNGIGIPAEYINKVFEMFFRADSHNKNGMGLGLYLSKISLNKLGGSIKIESQEGFGSIFTIKIPNIKQESEAMYID